MLLLWQVVACFLPWVNSSGVMLFASDKKVKGMARANTICCERGCPRVAVFRGRCREHARAVDRVQAMSTPTKRTRTSLERRRRRAVVERWRRLHGDVCPGFGCPPHLATDLTADHIVPIALGGSPEGELSVLCRSCNSRKQARPGIAARNLRNGRNRAAVLGHWSAGPRGVPRTKPQVAPRPR